MPIVLLNPTVVTPLLVERLRVAVPPRFQTEINSVTDAIKNWELVLKAIFTNKRSRSDLQTSG